MTTYLIDIQCCKTDCINKIEQQKIVKLSDPRWVHRKGQFYITLISAKSYGQYGIAIPNLERDWSVRNQCLNGAHGFHFWSIFYRVISNNLFVYDS